jgi:hypothetical protein
VLPVMALYFSERVKVIRPILGLVLSLVKRKELKRLSKVPVFLFELFEAFAIIVSLMFSNLVRQCLYSQV